MQAIVQCALMPLLQWLECTLDNDLGLGSVERGDSFEITGEDITAEKSQVVHVHSGQLSYMTTKTVLHACTRAYVEVKPFFI